ncbi:MAG: CooT family nickel-binding protein [Clostridia bacterium]|nr:CooT family nickel-binding protein [Clostridia bacterium]
MCEADVYLLSQGSEEVLFLDKVDKIIPQGDELYLENIFGKRKTVKARIKEMTLVEHRILLERL